jgi:prevent-host-death family protein
LVIRSERGFAMQKQIDVAELGQPMAGVLDEVVRRQEPYVVARDGEPEAVLVPYGAFLRWQRGGTESADEHFDRVIERLRRLNKDLSDDEVARDVEQAVAEVRAGIP